MIAMKPMTRWAALPVMLIVLGLSACVGAGDTSAKHLFTPVAASPKPTISLAYSPPGLNQFWGLTRGDAAPMGQWLFDIDRDSTGRSPNSVVWVIQTAYTAPSGTVGPDQMRLYPTALAKDDVLSFWAGCLPCGVSAGDPVAVFGSVSTQVARIQIQLRGGQSSDAEMVYVPEGWERQAQAQKGFVLYLPPGGQAHGRLAAFAANGKVLAEEPFRVSDQPPSSAGQP